MRIRTLALTFAAAAALSAALALPASAAIVNGGFETGDLTGWTAPADFVHVLTDADDATGNAPFFGEHYQGVGGSSYFAQLVAGIDVGTYTLLSQDFHLDAAGVLDGWAAFLAYDEIGYDDNAFVKIVKSSGEEFLFTRDVEAVDSLGHTDWTHFTSSVLSIGDYTLVAGVRNNPEDDTNAYSSQLLVDSFQITDAPGNGAGGVPEPAAWALMIVGFAGLGGALRRRRAGLAAA